MSTHLSQPTKIPVYELCVNDESLFADFFDKIEHEGNLISDLARAIRIIEDTSNLQLRPEKQFHLLHDLSKHYKVFESKAGSIRIYLFHEEKKGRIIITGGKKGDQNESLNAMKSILKNYYDESKE